MRRSRSTGVMAALLAGVISACSAAAHQSAGTTLVLPVAPTVAQPAEAGDGSGLREERAVTTTQDPTTTATPMQARDAADPASDESGNVAITTAPTVGDEAAAASEVAQPVPEAPVSTTTTLQPSADNVAAERQPDWVFTPIVWTSHQTASGPPESRTSRSPTLDLLLSDPNRPEVDIPDGAEVLAIASGSIGPRSRQTYVVEVTEGQVLVAALASPTGVVLDLQIADQVVLPESDQSQRLKITVPADGSWRLGVVSSAEETAAYALTVWMQAPEPVPVTTKPAPVRTKPRAPRVGPGSVVYLTFDDGPTRVHTPDVLDLLSRYNARATFFVLGKLVEKFPDLVQRIVAEGHTVANHTWNHENLAKLTKAEFDRTIGRTQEILGEHATACLRPPYAATNKNTRAWAAEYGLKVYTWSVSAHDWTGLNGQQIADRVLGQITDGSIVLMHDGGGNRTETVRGLEIILERLSGTGVVYEPLCDLLSEVG